MNQRRRKKMSEAVGDSGRVIGLLNIEGEEGQHPGGVQADN